MWSGVMPVGNGAPKSDTKRGMAGASQTGPNGARPLIHTILRAQGGSPPTVLGSEAVGVPATIRVERGGVKRP